MKLLRGASKHLFFVMYCSSFPMVVLPFFHEFLIAQVLMAIAVLVFLCCFITALVLKD